MPELSQRIRVDDLIVDRGARSAFRGHETLRLSGLTYDFLLAMIETAPNVTTFDYLMKRVWKQHVVSPENISQRAYMLRKALASDTRDAEYFEVVRGVGYRLLTPAMPVPVSKTGIAFRTVQTIAVMPFENLSGDEDQEFFCDGLVEDVTAALARVRGLLVIARNSSFTFKGKNPSIRLVADRLNVDWLLRGSIRRAGNRIRVFAELVETASERSSWSRTFDGVISDVFDLQDSLTAEIAKSLDIELVSGEAGRQRLSRYTTPEAGDALYKGMYFHYAYELSHFERSLAEFDRFIELEPNSVLGYAWKVMCLGFAVVVQWVDPAETLPKLNALVQRIFTLDANDPNALMGSVYVKNFSGDVLGAESAASEATRVAPNLDEAWFLLSWCQMLAGRPQESIVSMTRAIRLSPVVPATRLGVLATAYRNAGRYEESANVFVSVIENYPDFVWAHTGLATTLGLSGNLEGAREQVELALRKDPTYTVERFVNPDFYVDKSIMKASGEVLSRAGMPSALTSQR
ncbi:MAG: tetratricopeptide repeat protein [Pseudomonadota bacterium]